MVSKRILYSSAIITIILVTSIIVYVATRPPYVLPDLELEVTSVTYIPSYSLQVNGEIGYTVPRTYKIYIRLVSLQDGDTIYDANDLGLVLQPQYLYEGRPGPSWGMSIMHMIALESLTIQLTFNYTIQHIVSAELGIKEIVEQGSKTFTVNI